MLLRIVALAAAAVFSVGAFAEDAAKPTPDATMTVTAADQAAWTQIEPLFLQCTADATYDLPAGGVNCRNLHNFLKSWADKVKAAKPVDGAAN